jgi:hypothetical protein
MSKYSEVSSCNEVNASAPCSVEFALKAKFPDDKQQTYPAKGIPYRAHTPQGVVEGMLDGNGEVIISDTGIGSATIEVHPHVDKKITKLRLEIQTILNQIIQDERAEAAKIAKEYNKESYLGKVGENLKAEGRGLRNIGEGIWGGIKAIGGAIVEVTEQASEYVLDPLNAPETFKEDVKAIKATYHELKQSSEKAIEIYQTLKDDPKSKEMLKNFASDYIDAQHSTELFEHGAEMVAGIGLTLLTGGAAAAALGTRFAAAAAKLAPLFEKLSKLLKEKKWFHKKKTVQSNKKAVVTTIHTIKCFKPSKDLLKKSKDPKKLEKEFYRQLKDQEAGINKMSVSEYLKNRKTLNELTQEYGHTKARAILTKGGKAQREAREELTNEIKDSVKVSLSKQGIAGRKAEEIATQKAEEQLEQLAALHDPDLIAGGSDKISRVGDASVNSSIGSQWSKDGRVETLNKAAEAKLKAEGPDAKMDIKLTRCK